MSARDKIINAFETEFGAIAQKFKIVDGHAGKKPDDVNTNKPGVYAFYRGDEIWKIGKSNTDAYVRSQQHFRDDTGSIAGNGMKQYAQDASMAYLLFVLPDENDIHWAYALEYFLETHFMDELKIKTQHR
jgi:hypothetical protein